ncbi:MAG: hypothetical protein HY841_13665 [Bacteroidetes bacterium]|nr:hypothetical protein [Bacteroidota bacterium]
MIDQRFKNMNEKENFLFSILNDDERKDFQMIHTHFTNTSNLTIKITDKLPKEKVLPKEYEEYFEVHFFKFVLQGLSIKHLFNGTPINYSNNNVIYHDISSIFSLSRSYLESFLTINYLYFNFKNEEQAIFRYLLYSASGLNRRQSYPTSNIENTSKKEEEKKEIDFLINRIKVNTYFLSLHPKKQKDLLTKLLPYEIEKEKIFIETGLDSMSFHTMWKLFSNYSHSEFIEAMQVKLYINNQKEFIATLYGTFRFCLMLNCYLLIKLVEKFDFAKQIYNESNSTTKYAVEFWKKILIGIKSNPL